MFKALVHVLLLLFVVHAYGADSVCYGTTSQGALKNAVQLPADGANFKTYSTVARWLGRTYVHGTVNDIVTAAYAQLAKRDPKAKWMYGETGKRDGGPFSPHRTHQNGLSVDLFVPVVNQQGESDYLPTSAWNRYGYDIEFDNAGKNEDWRIDFERLAALILALDDAAKQRGVSISRVIFEPVYHQRLFATKAGTALQQKIFFMKTSAWVKHDEHIHVDFEVACQPLNQFWP